MQMITNPIPKSSLFDTPSDLTALDERIRQLPMEHRGLAYLYTMMAFNLAHKMVEEATTVDVYDDDGHRYDIPKESVARFNELVEFANKQTERSDEWYDAHADIANEFGPFMR